MSDDANVTILDKFDTDIIEREGWRLDRMFEDKNENSMYLYNQALERAKVLSAQCTVGLRRVTHNKSVFMEVYKKSS